MPANRNLWTLYPVSTQRAVSHKSGHNCSRDDRRMCLFSLSSFQTLPALKSFCVFCGVGILVVYLLQTTWFLAWMVLDQVNMRGNFTVHTRAVHGLMHNMVDAKPLSSLDMSDMNGILYLLQHGAPPPSVNLHPSTIFLLSPPSACYTEANLIKTTFPKTCFWRHPPWLAHGKEKRAAFTEITAFPPPPPPPAAAFGMSEAAAEEASS